MFRATKIVGYLKAMEMQGIGAKRLLAGTQIDHKLVAAPGYLISVEQYHAVVSNMLELTGNPAVAFTLGELTNIGEIGILGYAMASASSLRQALDVWLTYSCSLVGTTIRVDSFRDASPGYEATLSSSSPLGTMRRFEIEELLVRWIKVIGDLTVTRPVIGGLSFAYPAPSHLNLYEESFRCPLEFDAPFTTIRILAPDLSTPIRTMNEELFVMCMRHCRDVMNSLPGSGPLRSQLRSLFLATPDHLPDLRKASTALGLSAATLRRRLEASGQGYQAMKDEFRFDLAREYLRTRHMSPKQVAYLLGFTTPTAFSRAFKSWAGQTVGQFLNSAKLKTH
jgi:AraC-like DNA-binding protein